MIPKIVHWCWLSNDPIPVSLQKCMETWKENLPDYEFIHWNFERFPKGKSKWVDSAFGHGKYAFAADYIRLYALYHYGGIYLDMDVEVLKSFNPFLCLNTMLCWQRGLDTGLEVAAFGAEKHSRWVKMCLDSLDKESFVNKDGTLNIITLPTRLFNLLKNSEFQLCSVNTILAARKTETNKNIPVLPYYYFSPKSYMTGRISIHTETYSIHKFAGSWKEKKDMSCLAKFKKRIWYDSGLADLELKKRIKDLFQINEKE